MIKFLKKIPFFETTLLVWFVFVFFAYMYFHYGFLLPLVMLITGLVLTIAGKYILKSPNKDLFNIKIDKPLWQVTLFTIATTLSLAILIRTIGNHSTENLPLLPLLSTMLWVTYSTLTKILFLSFLVFLSASFGKRILNSTKIEVENKQEEFIFSFGIGFLAINYLSFLITALGLLFFWPSIFIIVLIIILSFSEIKYFIQNFLVCKVEFNISTNFHNNNNFKSWTILLIIFFLIISFLTTFRSYPQDIDDLTAYASVPQTYENYHSLVPFFNSSPSIASGVAMTFYANINILLSPNFVFLLPWLFFVFLISTIYIFVRKFFSDDIAIITLSLITFIPSNYYFITTQKLIFMFAFASAISLFFFFKYLNTKKSQWLYLSGIFIGYSISLKMNGLFLFVTLGVVLLFLFFLKKIKIKHGLIFLSTVILFCLPIFITNTYYYGNPLAHYLNFRILPSKDTDSKIFKNDKVSIYDILNDTNIAKQKSEESTQMGRQNKISESSVVNFFWLLWNITTNQKGVKITYVEISPYLLIFLPFFIYFFLSKKLYKEKNSAYLFYISSIFFAIWIWKGSERPWYGIALFYFYFIFCAIVLHTIKHKSYKLILYFFIALFCFTTLLNTTSAFSQKYNEIYYTPTQNQKNIQKEPYSKMINYINSEIINKNSNSLTLLYLESNTYGIKDNHKKVIPDSSGLYWGQIVRETESINEINEILAKQGISHVVHSSRLENRLKDLSSIQNESRYSMFKDIEIFNQYRDKYLEQLTCIDDQYCIYKIKK